jgi:hypothetical protein
LRLPLFRQRQLWLPTLWGWLVLLLAGAALGLAAGRNLYGFLALHRPVGGPLLVVEGWMEPAALEEAAAAFRAGGYQRVVTTGGPIEHWPGYRGHATFAERAAEYLQMHGVPASALSAVPAPASAQERTFLSAVMVREWAKQNRLGVDRLDVYSYGTHARRSRLLYRIAFGPGVRVGTYAAAPSEYEPLTWWRSSVGARDVLDQAIGLLWVKLFFRPPPPGSHEERWDVSPSRNAGRV